VLGDHVRQSGSLVDSEKLRFDFTHFSHLSSDEIKEVEKEINTVIQNNLKVKKEITDIESAMKKGAMAIFGEKYGEEVRVISVGDYSMELCGGCHVQQTGEIGVFKILSESSVASGIRRIEAVTGLRAFDVLSDRFSDINAISEKLRAHPEHALQSVEMLINAKKELEKDVLSLKNKLNAEKTEELLENVRVKNGVKLLTLRMDGQEINTLRNTIDTAKAKIKSGIVLIGSANNNKAIFICGVTKDLTDKYHAGDIVKQVAAVCGGSGGGKPDMAQAGGKNINKIDEALNKLYNII
jgi:alanyl-tRNA synthetase